MQTILPFFLRTLNLEPDFKPAPVNGGNSTMLLEHYNKAIGYYAKAVELNPQWALVGHCLALGQHGPAPRAQRTASSTGEHEMGPGDEKFARANRRAYQ